MFRGDEGVNCAAFVMLDAALILAALMLVIAGVGALIVPGK